MSEADVRASRADRPPAPAATAGSARPTALVTLLGATLLGTVINNILNVPLRQITRDLNVSVSAGVLVVSSFVIVLAAGIAISGWVGDRVGRQRIIVASLALMALAMLGAALAPSLPFLVAMRALQGLACAAYPPAVMGLLATLYGPERRARLMSAWAAANGLGQAIGPPVGGLLADVAGWRSIFWVLFPVAVLLGVATRRTIPRDRGRANPVHVPGAVALTLGAGLVMTAATLAPQHVTPAWASGLLAVVGAGLVGVFVVTSRRVAHPLIHPSQLTESRFLRSSVAASAQMFCLSATLVCVPLYVTGTLGRSAAETGLLVLALPLTMAALAPVVGLLGERSSPRRILRAGLLVLVCAELGLGVLLGRDGRSLGVLLALLVGVGLGVAMVQTPSATGATRSPAGRSGAALGLFNMMRFGGSALGAAWVAVVYGHDQLFVLFLGTALVAVIGLVVSFAGPDPLPESGDVVQEHAARA